MLNSYNAAPAQTVAVRSSEATSERTVSFNSDKLSVNNAVKDINIALAALRKEERQFRVDEDLERLVVKIIDADTRELIRQIPTEEALALSKKMQEMIGLLSD